MSSEHLEMIDIAISALSAIGTIAAVIVALWLGLREQGRSLKGRTVFEEKRASHSTKEANEKTPDEKEDVLLFGFDLVNTCSVPIFISFFLERGKLKWSLKSLKYWIKHCRRRDIGLYGGLVDVDGRSVYQNAREHCYFPSRIRRLEPGESASFRFGFRYAKHIQLARKKAGVFSLDKPLRYYAVDIMGKRYRLASVVTPNSFLVEETCTMKRVTPFE